MIIIFPQHPRRIRLHIFHKKRVGNDLYSRPSRKFTIEHYNRMKYFFDIRREVKHEKI